ncbi:hypothetical protein ACQ4PT_045748 [Festuca glaucescens]
MADESDGAAVESPRQDPDAIISQDEEEEEDEGFTFAPPTRLPGGGAFGDGRVIGHVYPVFGRPRSPPPKEEEAGTATVRVPLRQLLLAERGSSSPSRQEQPDDDDELDGVPAETYCLWSPGTSPSASSSPAQFPKSGSTGSVLRWRQRLQVGRSHSDGKEKFVFLHEDPAGSSSSPDRNGRASESPGGIHSWSYYGRGRGSGRGSRRLSPATFLPYKQELVGLFANASALRRSYHPF